MTHRTSCQYLGRDQTRQYAAAYCPYKGANQTKNAAHFQQHSCRDRHGDRCVDLWVISQGSLAVAMLTCGLNRKQRRSIGQGG